MRGTTALLAAHALTACAGAAPTPTSTAVEMLLPSLTLPSIAGDSWTSTSARGSVLVIDVWASWCKPCSKGFPRLDAIAARRSGVVVVAVSIDEDAAAIRGFIAQFPLAVAVLHDVDQVLRRPPLTISQLPTVLVVDADGVIRHRIEKPGEDDYDRLDALVGQTAKQ